MPVTEPDPVARAAELAARGGRTLLGIVGPPGAGKSTVAAALLAGLPPGRAVVVGMDGFHLAQAELLRLGRADRKGAPDTFDRDGYVALLARIRAADATVYAPRFRRELEEPIAGAVAVAADVPLVVTEGNYLLLWPEVRGMLDEVWWVACPDQLRLARLVARHASYGRSRAAAEEWVRRSDEANTDLIAPGRVLADRVVAVPGG